MPEMTINGVAVLPRISDYVDHFARVTPDAVAVVCRERRFSYGDVAEQVDAWSRALLSAGLSKGDRVAMLCTPRAEFWIVFLATTRIGAIWVGLNPRYSIRECEYVIDDAQPDLLVTITAFDGTHYQDHIARLKKSRPSMPVVLLEGTLSGCADAGEFLDAGLMCDDPLLAAETGKVETLDPALIVYTSGSTGSPKGAVLSHYGLSYGATMQTTHFQLDHPSIVVSFPINHVGCIADTCATTLVKGGKIVFQERFDPAESVSATIEEQCTLMGGVPTMFQMQMETEEFRLGDFSSLELFLWGGAAMPVDVIRRLQALGKRLITAYGMTETACHVTYTGTCADLDELAKTVGRPDPNCEIRIETDDRQTACRANPGELQVKGDFLMLRYWNREQATRDTLTEDGWLKTGDIAYPLADGTIRLVGRMSDMFKSGGYNVYPREIENVLESHPGIAMAAVVAVADSLYQEIGIAYLKLEQGRELAPDEAGDWCRQHLANYKIPKQFKALDELPLLPIGKIDKQALREMSDGQSG